MSTFIRTLNLKENMKTHYSRVKTDNFHGFCILCIFQGLFLEKLKRGIQVQNKHETYPLWKDNEWDVGRLWKTPKEPRGQRPPGGAAWPHHSAGRRPSLGFWPPFPEASSTSSPDTSRPLVKSVWSYGACASHQTINTWVDPHEDITNQTHWDLDPSSINHLQVHKEPSSL